MKRWVAACLSLLVLPLCFCTVSASVVDLLAADEEASSCCSHEESASKELPQEHSESEECPCCQSHGELAKLVPDELSSLQSVRVVFILVAEPWAQSFGSSARVSSSMRSEPPGSWTLQSYHQLMRC